MTRNSDNMVVIGTVTGAAGIKGWVKVVSYTDPPVNVFEYKPWQLSDGTRWRQHEVLEGRPQGKGLVARLANVTDRDAALALKGAQIGVARDCLPDAGDGCYYWTDLIGLTVRTTDHVTLGRITQMMETGANDVMVIDDDQRQRLVPFVMQQVVKAVDLKEGMITVDWDPEF
ncbi:MAG: ribosome maturation factor RimM [Gammaproteobacteria bacterium]|nr:ribosome maturation factor RimM [Gammaproteobacteria bacterium]